MKIKYLLFITLLIFTSTIHSQKAVLEKTVTEIAAGRDFSNAVFSVAVYDTKTGEKLYALNDQYSIATASTTKLFSTAAAISVLGDKQLETQFYIDGEVKEGVLYGNIWIRGGGDPAFGSKYASKDENNRSFLNSWCDSIKNKGIKKITGAIIGDASEFGYKGCPDGWSWSDMGNAYGACPSGLAIFDNVLNFRINTGAVGASVKIDSIYPYVPNLKFHNYITAADVQGDNSYIYGAPFQNERIGIGTLQKNTSIKIRGSLPDPEFQIAYELKNALQSSGVEITDSIICARNLLFEGKLDKKRYNNSKILFTYKGATIAQIASWTNQHSVNLFAEQLVCLLGYYRNGDGSHENGMNQLQNFWKNAIPSSGLFLRDGSGLSRSNGLSTGHLCALLNYMYKSTNYNTFFETLPVTGKSGTLKDICRNQAAHGKIHAKSGTMQRIKSYAGYAFTDSGRQLTFAIVMNNYDCSNYQATLKMQKIMNVLVTLP